MKVAATVAVSLFLATGVSAFSAEARFPDGTYTYHHDNDRTGWNDHESHLTVANVGSKGFGLIGTLKTDSVVYAEPLYVPHVKVGGVDHDLVIAVTENDTAYAFDAESGAQVWKHSVLGPNQTPQPTSSVNGCNQITPTIGISSTPVIDPATNSLYLVAKIAESAPGGATYHARLHSLDVASGNDNRPVAEIAGSFVLHNSDVTQTFTPQWQQQRPGLLLDHGVVYIGFGSSCDEHADIVSGWMFAYDTRSMKQLGFFNTATDYLGSSSPYYMDSIWQGTYAPAADENGDIYFATGNGEFDANVKGGKNYGESVMRLTPKLEVADYFTPFDQLQLSNGDLDVGSAGVMLVPPYVSAPYHLAVAGGKNANIFLLNRDSLGKFTPNGPDKVYQEIPGPQYSLYGGPALYDRTIYYGFSDQPLVAYALKTSPKPHLVASSHTADDIGDVIPAVSSDGRTVGTAVLWATSRARQGAPISLLAYDATNLGHLLFSGTAGVWNAHANSLLTATIGNGRVFVPGAGNGVAVFGLTGKSGNTFVRSR